MLGGTLYLGFSLTWGDYMDGDDIPEDYVFGAARGMLAAGLPGVLFIGTLTSVSGVTWPLWWYVSRQYHRFVASSSWRPNAAEFLIGTSLWLAIAMDGLLR